MPPDAICASISKMPFNLVPCARRTVAAWEEYMSDIRLAPAVLARMRRAGGGLIEPDDDNRHVVRGATVQRHLDEKIACALRRIVLGERQDLAILDMRRKTIATDDENIAIIQRAVG